MPQRQPKGVIFHQINIVRQTNPLRARYDVIIGEAVIDNSHDGVEDKDRDHQQGGREKKVRRERKFLGHWLLSGPGAVLKIVGRFGKSPSAWMSCQLGPQVRLKVGSSQTAPGVGVSSCL